MPQAGDGEGKWWLEGERQAMACSLVKRQVKEAHAGVGEGRRRPCHASGRRVFASTGFTSTPDDAAY